MKDNSQKIILDLCGGTGAWSEPYRAAGYDVRVITLPEWDVTQWQRALEQNVLLFYGNHATKIEEILLYKVHGILAAPPCTMFSRARTTGKMPRDFDGALEIVEACLQIIWFCRAHGDLQFWALENPMGLLRQFLGNPPHSFRGWEYGDDHVKFTDLWGYYTMPTPKLKHEPIHFNRSDWASPKAKEKYWHLKLNRAGIRSITPEHFAQAFFEANR